MAEARSTERPNLPACRWRTASETLDVIEALERIEALLLRIDQRLAQAAPAATKPDTSPVPDTLRLSDARP